MKKIIFTLAFISTMNVTLGSAFQWQAIGVAFDGTKVKNSTNLTGYAIYLGNNGALSDSYSWDEVNSMISDAKSVKNAASVLSKIQSTVANLTASSNGDVYGLLLTWDSGEDLYYALSSVTYTVSGISDATEALDTYDATAGFNGYATDKTGAEALTTGAGWQKAKPIPEPATGALALAGLALLIRRRRV